MKSVENAQPATCHHAVIFPLRRPQIALILLIASYVIVFFLLAKRAFDVFGGDSGEIGAVDNMMWWTSHGYPYRISFAGDLSNLAFHADFFSMALAPVYAIFPSPYTMIFLQSLGLGLAAVPVYLIVRHLWQDEAAAVLMAAAFLFLPSIVSGNLNQLHFITYAPVLLLFTAYFFVTRQFRKFIILALLACSVRENVALGIGMFGIWAWTERREWKWRLTPILGGAAYFLAATQLVIPWALHGHPWHLGKYFSYLGTAPVEIATTAITHPGLVIHHLLSGPNIQYFIFLVQPIAWLLPFGHPAALLALPDLAGNLLSDNDGLKVIGWHYQFMTSTGLFIGALCTMQRLLSRLQARPEWKGCAFLVAAGLAALCMSHWVFWWQPQTYRRLPQHAALVRALDVVGPDKSVIVPDRLKGHVSQRVHYDGINRFPTQTAYASQFEYVILDANERRYPPVITREFFDAFRTNLMYRIVFAEENVFVFQRLGSESDWHVQPVGLGP